MGMGSGTLGAAAAASASGAWQAALSQLSWSRTINSDCLLGVAVASCNGGRPGHFCLPCWQGYAAENVNLTVDAASPVLLVEVSSVLP